MLIIAEDKKLASLTDFRNYTFSRQEASCVNLSKRYILYTDVLFNIAPGYVLDYLYLPEGGNVPGDLPL